MDGSVGLFCVVSVGAFGVGSLGCGSQPVCLRLMVALSGLWRACGVAPASLVGHSVGEVVAAYVAGGFRLDDACAWWLLVAGCWVVCL